MQTIAIALGAIILGISVGYIFRIIIATFKKKSLEITVKQKMLQTREEAQRIIKNAQDEATKVRESIDAYERDKHLNLKSTEERLIKREEMLDKRQQDLDTNFLEANIKLEELEVSKRAVLEAAMQKQYELERLGGLTREEARTMLFEEVEQEFQDDLLVRMQKLDAFGKEKLDRRAQEIMITTMQRYANSSIADKTVTTVTIPNEDIKGKIIGKEGRNIRTFESATGVELIVDDTPGKITLSSFDPIRRQIARVALENLISDGRIQPARIEESVEKAKKDIDNIIRQKGEEAVRTVGIYDLDPRIVAILGRLHFRTSYSQNVLAHSIEMAHLAGMIADEIGADTYIAKAGALVHDIGKALDHEIQGTHVKIGMRLLQKFGTDTRIIDAMKSHHEEFPYETVESIIVQIADALSGGRPGARNDSIENYIRRLSELEAIANTFKGVEKSFAIQAGREIRVFVHPEHVSDYEAKTMAREMAVRIERELGFPGEIKIHIIRETRIIDYAR